MATTTILTNDTATTVRDSASRFSWGAVVAGAAIATGVTFFLVSLGSGIGLAVTSAHNATASGAKTFLTLGAIYFLAAQAVGFAVGGHITGRLMPDVLEDKEEENVRADAHGLAVWALAAIFGLMVATVATLATATAAAGSAAPTAAYWADHLLAPGSAENSAGTAAVNGGGAAPVGSAAPVMPPQDVTSSDRGTLADAKAEAARLLTVDAAAQKRDDSNSAELNRLVTQYAGLSGSAAAARVEQTEQAMRAKAKEAADAARKAASYVAIWTALALLFGAIVCVAATISARSWEDRQTT